LLTLTYVGVSPTYGPSSTPPTNAGIYTVTAAVEGDTTYQAANSLPATFTINPAAISAGSITVAPPIAGLTYDGNAKAHVATATGVGSFNYSYAGRNQTTYGPLNIAPTAAGFYTVTATSSDSNYTGSKSVDFTITKATPTISVAPTASPITVGQALSASILSSGSATGVGGVTVAGTFGWTSEGTIPSVTGSQGVTFTPTDTNYDTATTNVSVTVNPATPTGPTFTNTFGSLNPTNVGTDGLAYLMKYALGGTNTNDKVSLPTVSVNGSALTLTAVVRTNDTNVQILGQWVTGLGGTWSNVPTNPYGTASANTSNVPTGCERRDFSVPKDTNSRLFLRLKATQTP